MKARQEILNEINRLETEISELRSAYSRLCQIDILSRKGSQIREKIDNKLGQIIALKWVIETNELTFKFPRLEETWENGLLTITIILDSYIPK